MNKSIIPTCLAIVALAGLEAVALMQGINGVLFSGIAAIIGGLGGYQIHKMREKK